MQIGGYIGENSSLFDLDLRDIEVLTLDLAEVNYINSVGVKNWILWHRRFPQGMELILKNCPTSVVNQINMVAGFLPARSNIESIMVPYYCEVCAKEKLVKFNIDENYVFAFNENPAKVNYPEGQKCEREDCEMAPDILEKKYFHFLDPRRDD